MSQVSSALSEVPTTSLLRPTAPGLPSLIPGPRTRDISLPSRRSTRSQPFQDHLSRRKRRSNAELRESTSLRERGNQMSIPGMRLTLPTFQRPGTGVMSMELTTFPGTRTSISQRIAAHAGLREPPHLLLTDSTSNLELRTQLQLLSMLKLSSTATLVEAARVETQAVSTSLLMTRVSQTLLASNTLPMIQRASDAMPSTCARTAPGHHAQSDRTAKTNAGLLITRSTMLLNTISSPVPKR